MTILRSKRTFSSLSLSALRPKQTFIRTAKISVTTVCETYTLYICSIAEYMLMGIVKISDLLHEDVRDASRAMSRSVNAQAEYWIRLGMMSELYPELNYQQIKMMMLKSGSDRLMEVINAINSH